MARVNILLFCFAIAIVSCTSHLDLDDFNKIHAIANHDLLTDEQKAITAHNAKYLAFKEQNSKDSTFIEVDSALISFYYDALTVILTSEEGKKVPEIQFLQLHDTNNLHEIFVHPSKDATFWEKWNEYEIETGRAEIDLLLEEYNFRIDRIHYMRFAEENTYILRSEKLLNQNQISRLLSNTPFIRNAYPNIYCCDGSKISVQPKPEAYRFAFVQASDGCRVGCINRIYFDFTLFADGTVLYHD